MAKPLRPGGHLLLELALSQPEKVLAEPGTGLSQSEVHRRKYNYYILERKLTEKSFNVSDITVHRFQGSAVQHGFRR